MSETDELAFPACGAGAFALRRAASDALEVTCLDCDDGPSRVLVPTLRLEEPEPASPPDPELAGRLRDWRADEAADRGVPHYVVLHDRTIEELARHQPATPEALEEVHGIGPATMDRYGEALLDLVEETVGP